LWVFKEVEEDDVLIDVRRTLMHLVLLVFCACLVKHAYAGTTSYDYDELNRLTKVWYNGTDYVEYSYDEIGNLLAQTPKSTVSGHVANITATSQPGGSLVPSGTTSLFSGGSVAYTVTPAAGYAITGITVDGTSLGALTNYTFSNVTTNHSIAASFVLVTPSTMVSPSNNAFVGPTQTFTWNNTGASQYKVSAGSTIGGQDYGYSGIITGTSTSLSGIPSNGSTVYVRLWTLVNGNWVYNDYTYASESAAGMIIPQNGMALASTTQTFSWTNSAPEYQILVGSTVGGQNYGTSGIVTGITATLTNLPFNVANTIYVRLLSLVGNNWVSRDYTYTAANYPVRIARATPVYYYAVQDAYNAAVDGDVIQVEAGFLSGNITINRNISVTLDGGYAMNFSTKTGATNISGSLTTMTGSGTVTVKDFVFQP
jgi:hypothetical protein